MRIPNRIFISCVTRELGDLRNLLRNCLARAECEVKVQEDFGQVDVDTLEKLDAYIRTSAAVIHLVGKSTGFLASPRAVDRYLTASPGFLAGQPLLRMDRDQLAGLSYTQWEALIAVHHGVPIRVYRACGSLCQAAASTPEEREQQRHVDRLAQADPARHAEPILSREDLFLKLVGDLRWLVPAAPELRAIHLPSLWPIVEERTRRLVQQKVPDDELTRGPLYVRRQLEVEIDRFVSSERAAMVVVGQSGMGKTTLVKSLVRRYVDGGHLCHYVSSGELHVDPDNVIPHIVQQLVPAHRATDGEELWSRLDAECAGRKRPFILIIDAVNEYLFATKGPTATIPFMAALDHLAQSLHQLPHRQIKLLFTCRPETWRTRPPQLRQPDVLGVYHPHPTEKRTIEHTVSRFDEAEAAAAYEKYTRHHGIQTSRDSLSPLTRYYLSDPLLLRLACDVYGRDGAMPDKDFDTSKVFRAYHRAERIPELERHLITRIVDYMFTPIGTGSSGLQVQRDAVAFRDLPADAHELRRDLNPDDPNSLGVRLCNLGVLRREEATWGVLRGEEPTFRFTYDRFAEYLLSEELLRRIVEPTTDGGRPGQPLQGKDLQDRAYDAIASNLDQTQRGRHTLSGPEAYPPPAIRQGPRIRRAGPRLARKDERGLSLVVSTLASLAMRRVGDSDGLDTLEGLFRELCPDMTGWWQWLSTRRRVIFPLVDSAHRLLLDDEYRAYRTGLADERRRAHETFLQRTIEWAFCSSDRTESAAAVQYLHFLWQDTSTRNEHAVPITTRLIDEVKPFSLLGMLRQRRRTLMINLIALFILALGDTDDTGLASAILPLGRRLFRRVHLKGAKDSREPQGATARRTFSTGVACAARAVAVHMVEEVFSLLPNPVNLSSLEDVLAEPPLRISARRILDLLDKSAADIPDTAEVAKLAASRNGIVLELLTFAVSVGYENAGADCPDGRYLELIEAVLEGEPSPEAEYAMALALYHLNCFGRHATKRTVELMGRTAARILEKRKGVLTLKEGERPARVTTTSWGPSGGCLLARRMRSR